MPLITNILFALSAVGILLLVVGFLAVMVDMGMRGDE